MKYARKEEEHTTQKPIPKTLTMTKPIKTFVRKGELSFSGGGADGGGRSRTGSGRYRIIFRAGGGGGSERSEVSSEVACGDSVGDGSAEFVGEGSGEVFGVNSGEFAGVFVGDVSRELSDERKDGGG